MENQSNSDLSVQNPEKTSTSLVGQLLTLGIPNLNVVYKDDLCTVLVHDVLGDQSRLVVHAEVEKSLSKKLFVHYMEVMDNLFEQLKARGVTEVEAWVCEDHEIKYAQLFGFDQFLGELRGPDGRETLPIVYGLKKEL